MFFDPCLSVPLAHLYPNCYVDASQLLTNRTFLTKFFTSKERTAKFRPLKNLVWLTGNVRAISGKTNF